MKKNVIKNSSKSHQRIFCQVSQNACLASDRSAFHFTSVAMTDPRDSTKGRLVRKFSSCRFKSSSATCFLMSFASVTKKSWSIMFSSDCKFSCAACKRPRFWGLFAKAQPASLWICPTRVTAWLDWRRYRVFNAVLCFSKSVMRAGPLLSPCFTGDCAVFASASDQAKNATYKHAGHAQPQHACVAHTRVVEDAVYTWPWLCVCSWKFSRFLSVSMWSTVVRWLFIEKLTLLGLCREPSPFFCEDPFVLPLQKILFFVDHGIPRHPRTAHLVALSSVNICALGRALGVVGVAEPLHHRSETHVLAQLSVHILVALAMVFFCFKLRSS